MTCKDCLHYEACIEMANDCGRRKIKETIASKCEYFTDRSEWMKLPYKPMPLMGDKNPFNTDAYCPTCGEILSGYYGEEPLSVVQCYSCGEIIDTTKLQVKCDDKAH